MIQVTSDLMREFVEDMFSSMEGVDDEGSAGCTD